MINIISNKKIFFTSCVIIVFLFIFVYVKDNVTSSTKTNRREIFPPTDTSGFITSPSLYNEMCSYIKLTRHNHGKRKYENRPVNNDYIQSIKKDTWQQYPFSSRNCSTTSNQELTTGIEYCLLTNIYYSSAVNKYYFYKNPSDTQLTGDYLEVDVSYGKLTIEIIKGLKEMKQLSVAAVLTRPIYVGGPIDPNYAHGFLETFGPRFWVISELQSHGLFVDSSKIQIYYTSYMFEGHQRNEQLYHQQADGTYRDKVKWAAVIQSMFSDYPLLMYKSFNEKTVMFKYFLVTGHQVSRTPAWDYYYRIARSFRSHPFHTRQYRRAYLAYSEWLLKNLNLLSKFQLTPIQEQLQRTQKSESFPICNPICKPKWQNSTQLTQEEFTGDWIVVVNRAGTGRREMTNANELVAALLKTFPDHSNPYLRVWPKQLDFTDDLYKTAQITRSTRLMIGVHGAGLANTIFMRPGTILYEINPLGCRKLSFNFNRWATIFNLQHALWTPSQNGQLFQDDACQSSQASTMLVISEIINEVINLLGNEKEYRNGYLSRALHLLNDTSLMDHPQLGLERIT